MDKKVRCKICNSSQIYTRQQTGERVCKQCGHVEEQKQEEGGNE